MSCHDARASFPVLRAGKLRLTELVEIETHVRQCDGCGHALDRFYLVTPNEDPDRLRLPVGAATFALRLAGCAVAVVLVAGIGGYAYQRWYDPVVVRPSVPPPERLSSPSAPEAPPGDPVPSAPAVAPERSAVTQPRPASIPDAKMTSRSPSVKSAPASGTDVVVRVFPPDRREAERNLTSLLARLGGSRLARDQRSTVKVAVPRSRYEEFTRGLAQIGPGQIETRRGSLPDPVRVAVKLAR